MTDKDAPVGWGNVASSGTGMFVDEIGTYVVLVEDAWDSLVAPDGTKDKERWPGSHIIRMLSRVVAPVDSPQHDRIITLTLWCNSRAAQERAKGALERMNMVFSEDIGPEDPLSVFELVGQYARITVTEKTGDDDREGKPYVDVAPWNIDAPGSGFENNEKELRPDHDNEISVKHYQKELDKLKRTAVETEEDEDDLPF